jgi:uncharacterized membrane protein required for colicin V production
VTDEHDGPAPIGWTRAILTAAAIAAVSIAILVYGTNAILTKVHSVDRSTRVGIATAVFFVSLIAIAWVLRRLQRRHVI